MGTHVKNSKNCKKKKKLVESLSCDTKKCKPNGVYAVRYKIKPGNWWFCPSCGRYRKMKIIENELWNNNFVE